MAELPGWDRSRLLTAATADVEAARLLVYARVLEPSITEPYEAHLEVLSIESIPEPKTRDRAVKSHRTKRRNALLRAQAEQRQHRVLLELDAPDEPPDNDELEDEP